MHTHTHTHTYTSKDATKKLLEVINELNKEAAGYKSNMQKYVVFPYISNNLSEREIKKTIPFTISSKQMN